MRIEDFSKREREFIEKHLMTKEAWPVMRQAIEEDIIVGFKFTEKNAIIVIHDKDNNIKWEILYQKNLFIRDIEGYKHFKPGRYDTNYERKYGLTQEGYFLRYCLMQDERWPIIKEALECENVGIVSKEGKSWIAVADEFGIQWKLRKEFYSDTVEGFTHYRPERWRPEYIEEYGVTCGMFMTNYYLRKRDDWSIIEQAMSEGLVDQNVRKNEHIHQRLHSRQEILC